METDQIELTAFEPSHLDGALRLSQQAKWPHRLEDWQMALALSKGVVAVEAGGHVVGTVLVTPYKSDCATINMVIVDEKMRGRGLGRKLMDIAVTMAGDMPLRLVATSDGLPLYEKFGFQETGRIVQHQGVVQPLAAPTDIHDAEPADIAQIAKLDRVAFGADRTDLIAYLSRHARFAVSRQNGELTGFAALRSFGRGEVIGPVVAGNLDEAKSLIAFFLATRPGAFVRIDTDAASDLSPWLEAGGLADVGGGIVMWRPEESSTENGAARIFALTNQALG
ncbi:GNAT family N-acetyltransferase [Methylovirgula sp. 4M-Z18]|uniref:GNAT family N-acetyltransferase n=1 Tax=Methylovirgula sp. 4M-Z18 TaxID=2293567 RepID=UPI000E2F62FE|nr:GNAT family N-acetyltransferase [Methylovirgula sp. 4M-Z18]RFB79815.1 N-acetyltransferase [Methylovirgula sp. 4M-Z18]